MIGRFLGCSVVKENKDNETHCKPKRQGRWCLTTLTTYSGCWPVSVSDCTVFGGSAASSGGLADCNVVG